MLNLFFPSWFKDDGSFVETTDGLSANELKNLYNALGRLDPTGKRIVYSVSNVTSPQGTPVYRIRLVLYIEQTKQSLSLRSDRLGLSVLSRYEFFFDAQPKNEKNAIHTHTHDQPPPNSRMLSSELSVVRRASSLLPSSSHPSTKRRVSLSSPATSSSG